MNGYTMPSGKYRGWPMRDIPTEYLVWKYYALNDTPEPRTEAKGVIYWLAIFNIHSELKRRSVDYSERPKRPRRPAQPPNASLPRAIRREDVSAIISAGRRSLASKFHPDKPGGNLLLMQAVNNAADWLEQTFAEVAK